MFAISAVDSEQRKIPFQLSLDLCAFESVKIEAKSLMLHRLLLSLDLFCSLHSNVS